MTRRRCGGFSLMEALLAMAILAGALVPLLRSFILQSRVAAVSELHLVAGARGRRILEAYAALGYDTLQTMAGSVPGTTGDERPLPPALDGPRSELLDLARDYELPPHLARLQATVDRFTEVSSWQELDPDGLARVVTVISWEAPGRAGVRRSLRQAIVVARGHVAMRARPRFQNTEERP